MPTTEPPDSRLADLSSGRPVKSRLADAEHALKICKRFVDDDKTRAARRHKVQACFNGNAPKDISELRNAGRGNDSNLNFRRHRGQVMNAWAPLFDLVWEVPVCVDGDLEFGDSAQDAELMRGFAEYFHDLVFSWPGFDSVTQLCDLQMLLHGPGILAWQDQWDWRPTPILAGNFYVPDGTSGSLDDCEMAMISTSMSAGKLWRKIEKSKTAIGWNEAAVKQVIMDSALMGSPLRGQNWSAWDAAFKNGDHYVSQTQTRRIDLYTLFVEEMDGTISQVIIPTTNSGNNKDFQFIFEDKSRYQSWDECICLFPYDIGADGTFHSIKGLGTDIYPFCVLLNDIDNSIANLAVTGIVPMWQPTTGADVSKFQMVTWGNGKMVPNGINPINLNIGSHLAPALEISRAFSQALGANTAAAHVEDLAAPTVEETAKSAMIRAAERAKVSKGLHTRMTRSRTCQYRQMWARASNPKLRSWHPGAKPALEFQRRCYQLCDKLGVPHEALQAVTNIRAHPSLGLGSAALRIEIVNAMTDPNFIDRLDEQGQNFVLRMKAAAITSLHSVDAIVPSITTTRETANDESFAEQENNGLNTGGKARVSHGQNHVLHLGVHLESMEEDVMACQAGAMDKRDCQQRLEGKGLHSGEHVAILEGNPTRQQEFKEFSARITQVAAYQNHLNEIIAEEDEANPQEDLANPSPEMVKVHGQLALKAEKDRGSLALKAQNQQVKQAFQAQDLAVKTRRDDFTAAAKVRREDLLAVSKARPKPSNGNGG